MFPMKTVTNRARGRLSGTPEGSPECPQQHELSLRKKVKTRPCLCSARGVPSSGAPGGQATAFTALLPPPSLSSLQSALHPSSPLFPSSRAPKQEVWRAWDVGSIDSTRVARVAAPGRGRGRGRGVAGSRPESSCGRVHCKCKVFSLEAPKAFAPKIGTP